MKLIEKLPRASKTTTPAAQAKHRVRVTVQIDRAETAASAGAPSRTRIGARTAR